MKTFAERLNAAMNMASLSQAQLAERVGISQPAVQKMASGKTTGSRKMVEIARALNVRPEWLSAVIGAMKVSDDALPPENEWGTVDSWDKNTPLPTDEVEVPFLKDIEFACGNWRIQDEDHNGFKLRFSKATLRRVGANSDGSGVLCFPASGDSMEPVIPSGATVAVDTCNKKIIDGELYAINQGDLKRIKQLYRKPGGKLLIRSINRDYEDEEAIESDVEIIGFVFWYSVLRAKR
jgi:phage repressor protein C with HTH and peptisase S24 domain